MRQIVLDTETTGLDWEQGHRVIEIGCIEIVGRRKTERGFHQYVRSDRPIDPAAEEVHGISMEMLADKPVFSEIADEFLEFVRGAELIIHNASFDLGFLNNELRLTGRGHDRLEDMCQVLDTLALARQMHPGQRNSLDALCKRYAVDSSRRDLHGALLDARLLAEVFLAMTGGQATLSLDAEPQQHAEAVAGSESFLNRTDLQLVVRRPDAAEIEAHEAHLDRIEKASSGQAVWRQADA